MGASVIAKCACGYRTPTLMIGGGMTSYRSYCAFPAYCSEGSHLVTVNMFDRPLQCPDGHGAEPLPYNSPSLIAERGAAVVASWQFGTGELQLTDGRYFCPACRQETLSFTEGEFLWD